MAKVSVWSVWDVEADPQHPDNIYAGTEEGLKFSRDFGETWTQVSSDQLSGPIIAVAVNCNGTAVYVSDGDHGVKAAFAVPAASIPVDETTGVEYGRFTSISPNIDNLGGSSPGGQPGDGGQSSEGNQPSDGGQSSQGNPLGAGEIACMIEALGENVVRQLGPDGRLMSEEEKILVQHCF